MVPSPQPAQVPQAPLTAEDEQIQAAAQRALGAVQQADQQQAFDKFMTDALAVNLDEVDISTFMVAFVEWDATKVTGEDGIEREVRKPRVRHVQLSTYVPMSAFNHMLALRETVTRSARANGGTPSPQDMMEMMGGAVLPVWQIAEPDMTLKRLVDGLDFPRMQGLFGRFFSAALQRQTNNPQSGLTGRGASA